MKRQAIYFSSLFFVVTLLSLIWAPKAEAWYGTAGWTYRKSITIDDTKVPNTNQTDFPVLVDLTDANLQANAQADGDDILFTSSDGATKLSHEIELYVSATGRLVAWVKVPTLTTSGDTVLYMYYGNSGATNQQSVSATWNSGFKAVWHLKDGTTLSGAESTASGFNGTFTGSPTVTVGKVDGAMNLVTASSQKMTASGFTWSNSSPVTVSYWQNLSTADRDASGGAGVMAPEIITNKFGGHSPYTDGNYYWDYGNTGGNGRLSASYAGKYDKWTYVTVTSGGGTGGKAIYFDGTLAASSGTSDAPSDVSGMTIGLYNTFFQGKLDEFRISNVVRTGDWISTEYNNQNATSTFYSIGSEEEDVSDVTAPTITNVSSDKANGSYTVGEVIDIDVTFSEAVTSTGNVTVTLETGATDRTCTFSVSNSTAGTCNYTVQAGDTTSDLTTNSISGTIADQSANAMVNFTPATNLAANKALVIDTTAPSAPGTPDMTSGTDQGISSTDNITSDATPDFTISCETGATVSLKEDSTTLGTGTCSGGTVSITSSTLSGGAHSIKALQTDVALNVSSDSSTLSVTIDTTAPTITNVSSDKTNGNYTTGEVIDIDVTFSEAVTSTGNVTVTLETGATDRTCTFSVSNSTAGTCNYTVVSGDTSSDLTTNNISGTVADTAGNAMSNFSPATNLAANKALVIDTTAPTVSITAPSDLATVSGSSVSVTANASDSVGISGVQFKLDGANLGSEDTTSTYGITWDSTTATDGSHTLSAVARDAAGNTTTATNITVTVDNISAPTVTTSAASSVTETAATLNGNITATNGENATEHGFAYGIDSGLNVPIATSTNGAFSGTGAFTSNISSLTCESTYYARAYATNSAGTSLGSVVSFTTSACPLVVSSSGGSGGGTAESGRRNPVPLDSSLFPPPSITTPVNQIVQTVQNFVPNFLSNQAKSNEPKIAVTPPSTPSLTLEEDWDLISNGFVNNFVLAELGRDVLRFTEKFPELKKVFSSIGVNKISDLEKLKNTEINLPATKDGSSIPTEVLLAYEGSINIDSSLDFTTSGKLEQKIHVVRGQPFVLKVKPVGDVDSVKGLLTFRQNSEKTAFAMPLNSMTASAFLASESLAQTQSETVAVEDKLLVLSFDYTDPDNDSVYAANIDGALVEGEYEIITIINYKDKELGSKELRLTTVIDPEGYVYSKNIDGEEVRISDAKVSIFEVKNGTESIWNASKFKQQNPQVTDKTGKYAFLVPEGTYFITAEAKEHSLYRGQKFTVREGEPIHMNIELRKIKVWQDFIDWKVGVGFVFLAILITHLIDRRRNKYV